MRTAQKNGQARFWILWNGSFARVKLNAGESLTVRKFSPTDEGWSRELVSYHYDGNVVAVQGADEGQDCDGRHGNYWVAFCSVHDLGARSDVAETGLPVPVPAWVHVGASQFDENAERAGY